MKSRDTSGAPLQKMNHFVNYFKSNGIDVIESDHGFISYTVKKEVPEECFINAIYVDPSERGNGASTKLLALLVERALESQCRYLSTGVVPGQKGAEEVLHTLLHHEFSLLGWHHSLGMIIFKLELSKCLS